MEKSERVKVKLDCAYCGFSGTVRAFPTQNKKQCPKCHELIFLRYATGERGELDKQGYYFHAFEPYGIEEINEELLEAFNEHQTTKD